MRSASALVVIIFSSIVADGCADLSALDRSDRWMRVARDSNYDISLDTTRIERRNYHEYLVWYRTDHAKPHMYEGKEFNREIVQGLVACGSLSFKIAAVDMSMGSRPPVTQQRAGAGELGQQPWRQVERGTIEETAAHAACDFVERSAPGGSRRRP